MEAQEARDILAKSSIVHTPEAVQAALQRLADEISVVLAEKNPLVLCVMTGGLIFTGQLLPKLKFPLEIDYLHVTRYGQNAKGGKLSWRSAPWTTVKGRTVLVLDDILDEGLTLAAVCESIKRLGAAEVHTAVFTDKENGKQKPVKADFVGLSVPDRFVFGFGMDINNAWRHLPAIYALEEDK